MDALGSKRGSLLEDPGFISARTLKPSSRPRIISEKRGRASLLPSDSFTDFDILGGFVVLPDICHCRGKS